MRFESNKQPPLTLLRGIFHHDSKSEWHKAVYVCTKLVATGFQLTKVKSAGAIGFHCGEVNSILNDLYRYAGSEPTSRIRDLPTDALNWLKGAYFAAKHLGPRSGLDKKKQ